MHKKPPISSSIKRVLLLISVPILLTSTGYALFSQQLSVSSSANNPAYSSSQSLAVSYTKTITPSGSNRIYAIAVTITNNGTRAVTAWQSDFSLPADYSALTCTNSTCSQTATTNTAVNTANNGTINAGGTLIYNFTFTTADQNYLFTSLAISGTPIIIYGTVSGLSVTVSAGSRSKQGRTYTFPYTFTVTNNSGQALAGWRFLAPWSTTENVVSMDTTVDYTTSTSQLTILSKQSIQTGTSFQFTGSISSTNSGYTLTGYTIEGQI
jgi:hypothetical protein